MPGPGRELRALIKLSLPMVGTQLAQMGILTTDILLLGRLSTQALAAAAVGNTLYFLIWLIGCGPGLAAAPMIAQLTGLNPANRTGVRHVARMGLWAAGLLTLPLGGVLLCAGSIFSHLGQPAEIAADAGRFARLLCLGLPCALGFQVLRGFVTGLGKANAALWVFLASIGWNALAGYSLIFGHFGFRPHGLIGAGLATSSSGAFSFLAMLCVIRLTPALARYNVLAQVTRPDWPVFKELLKLSLPISVTIIFEAALFQTMTLMIGTFGTTAVAAHQIALNVASIAFNIPMGIGMAAMVRVGNATGARDPAGARRSGFTALLLAIGVTSLSGVIMIGAGHQIARLYVTSDSPAALEVISLATLFLKVAGAFQIADGVQVVSAFALRGLKDTRVPMLLAAASYWAVGAPVCFGLGFGLGLRALGVWLGLAVALAVAAILMTSRFHYLTAAEPSKGSREGPPDDTERAS